MCPLMATYLMLRAGRLWTPQIKGIWLFLEEPLCTRSGFVAVVVAPSTTGSADEQVSLLAR